MKKELENISINRNSSIPLHVQLTQYLKNLITNNVLKNGDMLPAESELAKLANVSTAVVRQTYNYLRRAGLIYTQQGKGTFVSRPKVTIDIIQSFDSFDEAKRRGMKVETEVVEISITKDVREDIKRKLKVDKESYIIKLIRLRKFDDIKMFYWTSYLPYPLCKEIITEDLTKISLFDAIRKKLKIKFSKAERWVQIVRADSFQSSIFGITELDPLFFIESITYTEENQPIEYYEGLFRADFGRIYFEVK